MDDLFIVIYFIKYPYNKYSPKACYMLDVDLTVSSTSKSISRNINIHQTPSFLREGTMSALFTPESSVSSIERGP